MLLKYFCADMSFVASFGAVARQNYFLLPRGLQCLLSFCREIPYYYRKESISTPKDKTTKLTLALQTVRLEF